MSKTLELLNRIINDNGNFVSREKAKELIIDIAKRESEKNKELEQWKDDYYKLKDKYEPEILY